MSLDLERSRQLMEELAADIGATAGETALGIIRVVNANMERAIRAISLERGYDPRRFTLIPFGGAGPMHSCELAQALAIPRVLIPPHPGILSALGVAVADVVKDYSRTVMLQGDDINQSRLEEEFHGMENLARRELAAEGLPETSMKARRFLDVRYVGQSFELTIDCPNLARRGDLTATIGSRFFRAHRQRFGYADRREAVEIVNLRLKLEVPVEKPAPQPQPEAGADPAAALLERVEVTFPEGNLLTNLYDRELLQSGNRISGPALVLQLDTTVVVSPGWGGRVDALGNILLERV